MKRILNYPGSKWDMADIIISLFPEHKSYCEPFFGSGAVFFNKKKEVLETINDIDGRLVNLFKQMRDHPEELAKNTFHTLYSREEYDLSFVQSDNELEDARRMLVRCWMSIGGKTNAKVGWRRNISWNGPYNTYDWKKVSERVFEAAYRLKDAQIENKDAITLIKELDKETLIYADPPYIDCSRKSKHYENEMTDADHINLLNALREHPGPVILSGYESKLYDEILTDWYKVKKDVKVGITSARKRKAEEILFLNFKPTGQLELF